MKIVELHYSSTNTYLIEGGRGILLFDTGYAGTLPAFFRALKAAGIPAQEISNVLISHFHPDHCGIAGEIAELGPKIAVTDVQKAFLHAADPVFAKEKKLHFTPIREEQVRVVPIPESREFLGELGISGEILHTPGHSEDSISLCLDSGDFFVGDLNPLYELPLHRGTETADSWEKLLSRQPKTIYYGHAKTARIGGELPEAAEKDDRYRLAEKIMKCADRQMDLSKIRRKTGADPGFIEDVLRMYLTHPGVSVQGILDRIEIKGK